jgi:hypothetical protein
MSTPLSKQDEFTTVAPSRTQRLLSRAVVWPVVLASYAALLGAFTHWLTDTWSGAASLGIGFAIFIGAPAAAGYAGHLWWKYPMHGSVKLEAVVCAALPVGIVALWASVTYFGRLH